MHGCVEHERGSKTDRNPHIDRMAKETMIHHEETQRRARFCLSCRGSFESAWVGERICPRCKGTLAWRSGSTRTYTRS